MNDCQSVRGLHIGFSFSLIRLGLGSAVRKLKVAGEEKVFSLTGQ